MQRTPRSQESYWLARPEIVTFFLRRLETIATITSKRSNSNSHGA
jgi:hypothetical protein